MCREVKHMQLHWKVLDC
ncbi:unnamed protein product [Timema podura]|uniref:Uncharacterized protein n=1 Tax=Timema podura TaxID=61482 RepID=A0ABN7PTE2_TIMPD|nr:unnamed protein product [Timema podura]